MTKISTRTGGITCRAEFKEKVNTVAQTDIELRALTAEMDAELQNVRDRYAARLETLTAYRDSTIKHCAIYAKEHAEEVLTPGLRSGETALADYGFRLGTPALTLLNRKHTWSTVLDAIKAKGSRWTKKYLIKAEPKVNKDALKANLSDVKLAALGLRIEQKDAFYIDPKDDNTPTT